MKRKTYEEPTMQVVKLQQTGMLMTSGPVNATMDGEFTEESASPEMFDDFTKLIGELQ